MQKVGVFSLVFNVILLVFICISFYQYKGFVQSSRDTIERYRTRAEQYEQNYTTAIDANRRIAEELNREREVVVSIKECAEQIGDSLQRTAGSIKELRDIIREIQKRYEAIEEVLNRSNTSCDTVNDSSNS